MRKAGILWSWDIRGMSPCDASRTPESAQVTIGERAEAVPACQTVPYDWRMHKIQKAAGQSARRLTDLLTRPVGTGETTRDTGDAHQGLRRVSETRRNARDREDVRRMAHNPEVEGSNPSPATKARGPLSNRKRASGARFVNVALVYALSRVRAQTVAA